MIDRFNRRHAYIARTSHKSGSRTSAKKSKFERAKFLAWDGEGVEHQGRQVYGLLANSQGECWIEPTGLSTRTCLEVLTAEKYTRNTIHVVFGGSYDCTMMLRDLPEKSLRALHAGDRPVHWQEFILEYRARKSLTISRCAFDERNDRRYILFGEKGPIIIRTMTLWDVFGFFQKKFVSVLQEWFRGTPLAEKYAVTIQDIIDGKQRRGSFSKEEMQSFVVPYCLAECRALKDLMGLLAERLKEAELVLARWDGAGAVSSAALMKYGVKSHIKDKDNREYTPPRIIRAAEHAFFGGWIETFLFGTINHPIYHYDICSAYPDGLRLLPSVRDGVWKRLQPGEDRPFLWIAHIEWQAPHSYLYGPCPFSWRGPGGYVRRPLHGRGWQWGFEIEVAEQSFADIDIKYREIWGFFPATDIKPFVFIEEMYASRAEHKKQGLGVEKVEKLAMNGCYGKTAQSLGYNKERKIKPPFHSAVYAGATTAYTRAKILAAVANNRHDIISIATDGIYSLRPLDVAIGTGLGEWEYSLHENMTLVQAGFYWFSTDGIEKSYYRGFNEGCVSREQIDALYLQEEEWSVSLPTKRFVTLGTAIGLNDFSLLGTWREKDRALDLYHQSSSKRIWLGERKEFDSNIKITRARNIDEAYFVEHPDAIESAKYAFEWDATFDGQQVRDLVEEMFCQELSPEE